MIIVNKSFYYILIFILVKNFKPFENNLINNQYKNHLKFSINAHQYINNILKL